MEHQLLPQWIESLGYLGAFLGAILEGELLYIGALQAARLGYLYWPYVVLAVFLGTLAADWGYFFLGRWQGYACLRRFSHLRSRVAQLQDRLDRRAGWLLLSYRFLYGFRIILPILFGISALPVRRFLWASLLSVSLWTGLFGLAGFYVAGTLFELLPGKNTVPLWIVPLMILGGIALWQRRKGRSGGKMAGDMPEEVC